MTDRDELIDAGARALDAKWGDVSIPLVRDEAATVIDAVEPIIRADERSYSRTAAAAWRELADLRDKVEALPQYPGTTGTNAVWRSDVLALLGGDDD